MTEDQMRNTVRDTYTKNDFMGGAPIPESLQAHAVILGAQDVPPRRTENTLVWPLVKPGRCEIIVYDPVELEFMPTSDGAWYSSLNTAPISHMQVAARQMGSSGLNPYK